MYAYVWQKSNKQHSSHTAVLNKFYLSLGVMHTAEAQSVNIGNLLKSRSLSYLYNCVHGSQVICSCSSSSENLSQMS